jgi:hypothetical protein
VPGARPTAAPAPRRQAAPLRRAWAAVRRPVVRRWGPGLVAPARMARSAPAVAACPHAAAAAAAPALLAAARWASSRCERASERTSKRRQRWRWGCLCRAMLAPVRCSTCVRNFVLSVLQVLPGHGAVEPVKMIVMRPCVAGSCASTCMDTFKRRAYVYDDEAPPLREAAAATKRIGHL